MKKLLFSAAAIAALSLSASAQTRMTISEEFTGENCPPCATTNPGFWTLLNGASNPSKIIHLAYMCPIPSSGWFYLQTKTLSDNRQSYYSVPFAPYHRFDGKVPNASASSPGHPGNFTQADIDAEYAISSPFNMTVSNAWNATYDTVITTVNITCVTAWTASSGTAKLRAALAQNVIFATPPGTNGETDFENVVRAMYPDANGTTLPSSWTAGMTQTIVLRGAFPSFAEKDKAPFMAVWIQDDVTAAGTKPIAQAAKATPLPPVPNDAAVSSAGVPITCTADGSFAAPHSFILRNAGSNAMTTATVYYKVDGGTLATYSWAGSLAPAATTTVTLPTTSITVSGPLYHTTYDSVGNVNGVPDQNNANNAVNGAFFIESSTALTMPYTTSFEGTDYMKHYTTSNGGTGWSVYYNTSTPLGHTGSYAAKYNNYVSSGISNVFTMPVVTTTTNCAVDFWVSGALVSASNTDKLEVVYSTNCGSTWTPIWSLSGSALSDTVSNYYYTPKSPWQYAMHSASMNSVPVGSMVGFRATGGGGQNLWLDDINMRTGPAAVGTITEVKPTDINIFPNPANDQATVSFTLEGQSDVQVNIIDAVGRTVSVVANEKMTSGYHSFDVNTSSFAVGTYTVIINTDNGKFTSRFSVAK